MNILMVSGSYYPLFGGVGAVMQSICEELVKVGHNCTVLTINPNHLKEEEIYRGVHIIRLCKSSDYLYDFNLALWSYLRNSSFLNKFDIVHIHGYHSLLAFETAYICTQKNVPFIFSPYYHGVGHTQFRNLLFKFYNPMGSKIFNWSRKITCVSMYEMKLLNDDFHIPIDNLKVIPGGVRHLNCPKSIKLDTNKISLLYVGALREYKGVQYILKAMYKLKKECNSEVFLTIVGSGEFEEELRNLAFELNLINSINWFPSVGDNELYEIYQKSNILFLLSRAESYGLVVAEALALGIPCIVSNTTALEEFTHEPGCFGISYPPDSQKLATLILDICSQNIQLGPFSHKIRLWNQIAKQYEKLYLDVSNSC